MDTGLLENGYRPTQKWIQAYSKMDIGLLENKYRHTNGYNSNIKLSCINVDKKYN